MNLLEQIKKEANPEHLETVPAIYHITKEAENGIYFFAEQLDCSPDYALEILARYASSDCLNIFEKLGVKFDPSKSY